MRTTVISCAVLCLFGSVASAQGAKSFISDVRAQQRPWTVLDNTLTTLDQKLYCVKADGPIALDGKLDEAAWAKAFSVSAFGRDGFKGYSPHKNTVRLLYDDKAIYVGCTGEVAAWNPYLAQQRKRDVDVWMDDAFEVFIDPGLTRKTYFQLIVNAVGSVQDAKGWDAKWDGDWKVAVSHDEKSWTAEIEIPYAAIGAQAPRKGDVWGLNVARDDRELKESSCLSPVQDTAHNTSRFMPMEFGDVPPVFLDEPTFSQVVMGDNVLSLKALGGAVAGVKIRGKVTDEAGKELSKIGEVAAAASGLTSIPFKLTQPGKSHLELELAKDGKVLGKYSFLAIIYNTQKLVTVTGGKDIFAGTPFINLRLDVRMDPKVVAGQKLNIRLEQGGKTLRSGSVDKIPGVYTVCNAAIGDLPVGKYDLGVQLATADGKVIDETHSDINIVDKPVALSAIAAPGPSPDEGPLPEQFGVWGQTGQDIKYRKPTDAEMKGKSEKEIEEMRKTFDCREWPEVRDESQLVKRTFSGPENKQGFVLFTRDYNDPVYYYTVPRAEESVPMLSAFAAQGQYQVITFSVHALKELKNVKARVTALRSDQKELPPGSFDLRVVRCYERAYGNPWWDPEKRDKATGLPQKQTVPMVLEKRPEVAVPAGESRQFWITLKVPDDCPAGEYTGVVALAIDGQQRSIPLAVRVLPFKLAQVDKSFRCDRVEETLDNFIDYREHGFNVLHLSAALPPADAAKVDQAMREYLGGNKAVKVPTGDVETVVKYNIARFDKSFDLARKANFKIKRVYLETYPLYLCGWVNGWFTYFPNTPEIDNAYAGLINGLMPYFKQKGAEVVVVPGDEPGGHPDSIPGIVHYFDVLREKCPGAKGCICVGGGMAMGMDEMDKVCKYLDVVDSNFMDAQMLKDCRKMGKEVWIYNAISMTVGNPRMERYAYGFYHWKTGLEGVGQWVWRAGDVYDQVYRVSDGTVAYVFPSAQNDASGKPKPLPTVYWECWRQGFIDQQYGATLTRLIQIAEKDGDSKARKAAGDAKAVMKDVLSNFPMDYMNRRFPAVIKRDFILNSTDGQFLDVCRWRIAEQIMKLQQALGDKANIDPQQRVMPMTFDDIIYN